MKLKGFTAVAVAIALSAAPAVASNVTGASALSLTPAVSALSETPAASALSLTPAMETVEGSQQADSGTWVIVGLGVVAAGLGIWALADGGDEAPVSP